MRRSGRSDTAGGRAQCSTGNCSEAEKQKEIHSFDNTIDGYRIQIFMESGNDAVEHANTIMSEFRTNYPDVPIYLVFGQPYYRLRVGDFRTRLEAEKFFQTLSQEYKKAFVTSDRIQLPYNIFCDPSLENVLEDIDNNFDTIQNDTIFKINHSIIDTIIN